MPKYGFTRVILGADGGRLGIVSTEGHVTEWAIAEMKKLKPRAKVRRSEGDAWIEKLGGGLWPDWCSHLITKLCHDGWEPFSFELSGTEQFIAFRKQLE